MRIIISEELLRENLYRVYHGTNEDVKEFKYSKIGSGAGSHWYGQGFYFTDSPHEASNYGTKIIEAQVELRNPLDLTQLNQDDPLWVLRLLSSLGANIQWESKDISEVISIYENVLNEFDPKGIHLSSGSNEHFKHVSYEFGDKYVTIHNRTKVEYEDINYMRESFISKILGDYYGIETLPQKLTDIISPSSFTNLLRQNNHDGVIAHNSGFHKGFEYVVFDKDNIKILDKPK